MAAAPRDSSTAVKSALRTLDIIEMVVATPGGVVAQDIARTLAIPVSSLSYLLATLVERGYLDRQGRRYLPGGGLERLNAARVELSLVDKARPVVKALRSRFNETVSFFALDGWEIRADITETSDQPLRYSIEEGQRAPMWCVAGGKAVLAAFDEPTLDRFFAEVELVSYTATTIATEADLRREIARVREVGYAVTRDERTLGISGLGQAVLADGRPVGALGVALPTVRFDDVTRDAIVRELNEAAARLSSGS